mgnify:CR=1 FL=1
MKQTTTPTNASNLSVEILKQLAFMKHEGEGYFRLTNDIKQAKVMSSIQIADEVLNLCKRSRGMFHYDIVTIS